MITISTMGTKDQNYVEVAGCFGIVVPGCCNVVTAHWSPVSGFASKSQTALVNTAPPQRFSYGVIHSRDCIGKENNCFHLQCYGNVDGYSEIAPTYRSVFIPTGESRFNVPTYRSSTGGWSPSLGHVVCYNGLTWTTDYFTVADSSYGLTLNRNYGQWEDNYYVNTVVCSGNLESYSVGQFTYRKEDELTKIRTVTFKLVSTYVYRHKIMATYTYRVVTTDFDGSITTADGEGQYPWLCTSTLDLGFQPLPESDIVAIRRQVSNVLYNAQVNILDDCHRVSFYEACKDAVSSISSLDMNNIENSTQFRELKKLLPAIADIRDFKKHPLKAASSLYLWKKYVADTSAHDIAQVISQFDDILRNVISTIPTIITRYGTNFQDDNILGQSVRARHNCKVRVKPLVRTSDEALMHKLSALGLEPGLANGWDLIPFSFVIDWFLGIGDLLDDVDYNLITRNRFDLVDLVVSTKGSLELPLGSVGSFDLGTARIDYYYRRADRTFPQSEFNFGSSNPSKHILDGLALVIANW